MNRLSACLITFNEERNLPRALTSLAGIADEIAAMWLAAPWSWFQNYVLYLGFLDGYRGWLITRMAARGAWLKFQKLGKLVEAKRHAGGARTP
jgi:hypothetical protein